MSYPEFRLRPFPEAWMNGLILSLPPFFLSDFPGLSPPPLQFPLSLSFKLSHPPPSPNPYIVSVFISLSLSSASHFGCPFLLSSLPSLPLSFPPLSLSALTQNSLHSPTSLLNYLKGFFSPQQWPLSELQTCFHSEKRSTCALRYPNFHP